MLPITRRTLLAGQAGAIAAFGLSRAARASGLRPLTINLAWYAQAPVGGFYQALARGFYRDAGLDVTIAMGGPQVNAVQLMLAGRCDFITGYDFQTLNGVARGMPLLTVGASFQHDVQGMILHQPAASLADLKGKRILIASSSHQTFWPWLSKRYGLSDTQLAPYTFNLQPFFTSPDVAFQGYASSEMFDVHKAGIPAAFFQFSDAGYPPYGTTIVTTKPFAGANSSVVTAFIRATMLGWRDYLHGDPGPGNALIRQASSKESPERIAFGIDALRTAQVLTGKTDPVAKLGTMTAARWQATRDFMVANGLLAADVPWQDAFSTRFADEAAVSAA
ncbi:ABC transporter substrate-binding protein [Tanticharoenia sakaeratensis]|uniref:Nitrate/sulfonate/bicarbonate ABC transporter periplasmic protein n=1 Tax=Tanticharoenia sakaeratensis NBRC 103193 TaxID=1231623 RepID=A0A0D6MM38_9PROT|nr:ABC transporter substrate-binding protein [Tanticharoenia sakaeratensis]GAN54343.1 nitrate/sulfonate/bicarbonate ABC transporter periplasmic protein [Tanticharoenia sakaeratensis NBRC 103193]GBQ18889.1 nitrate/sulfonate/bicarbonate ABC transporter periplasmic protein [Tanticharoenia sakaeratensis NBRC 103193]